jgi:uncharacterized protein involved in outer membrane biogenesis
VKIVKKFFKWVFLVIAFLVVLLLVAAIALPFVLPLDRIKDFVASKMSETLKREVTIGKVSFNVFTGIGIDNIKIGNKPGFSAKPFVKADKIELKYDLWSLFKGKFMINRVALVGPSILLEQKNKQNNYSDLIPAPAPKEKQKEQPSKGGGQPPIGIDISIFQIKNGSFSMVNYTAAGPVTNGFNNLYLTLSGVTLDLSRPLGIVMSATVIYENKPVPVSLSALVRGNLAAEKVSVTNLKIGVAGEYISSNINVNGLSKNQDIKFDLKSDKLNIDKFLAIVSGKGGAPQTNAAPAPKGALTRSANEVAAKVPAGLKVDGKINLNNITFKQMVLNSLNLNVSLGDKVLNLSSDNTSAYGGVLNGKAKVDFKRPGLAYSLKGLSLAGFDAKPATNDFVRSFMAQAPDYMDLIDKVEGTLNMNADISGSGVELPEPLSNATGTIYLELRDGVLHKLKSLEQVGAVIGMTMFKSDMAIKIFKVDSLLSRGIMNVRSLHADNGKKGDIIVDFKGKLNLLKQEYISGNDLKLSLSPKAAPPALNMFKDSSGWAILEFELTGSLSKPIPLPKFDKPLEKVTNTAKGEVQKLISKEVDSLKNDVGKELQKLLKF